LGAACVVVEHACQTVDLVRCQQRAQLITNVLQTELLLLRLCEEGDCLPYVQQLVPAAV
jgi:hypothetical protein